MNTLDPRLENFFSIRNLHVGRGEETPQFDGVLTMNGKDVANVRNHGRGGVTIFHWILPLNRKWAEEKLYPLATKIAVAKDPEFKDLYQKSGDTALEMLVFDYIEKERTARTPQRLPPPGSPATLSKGTKVLFGKKDQQKMQGKVVKMNRKTVTVELMEEWAGYNKGTIFRVSPGLLTLA